MITINPINLNLKLVGIKFDRPNNTNFSPLNQGKFD